jgi:hypothetical protein
MIRVGRIRIFFEIAGSPKNLTPGRNGHNSRRKQKAIKTKTETQLISNKESILMQIARIYAQEDARPPFPVFLTTQHIPAHDERNTTVLTSSQVDLLRLVDPTELGNTSLAR